MLKSVRSLSDAEAAYIAGVVDGEGTISLVRKHGGENRRAAVSVANTELELLTYLRSTIGAGRITRKRISQAHHTPSYVFVVYSRQALALLRQLAPFMRTHKRKRAELLLARYLALTPRNGKYTAELAEARAIFEDDFLSIRVRAGNPVRP